MLLLALLAQRPKSQREDDIGWFLNGLDQRAGKQEAWQAHLNITLSPPLNYATTSRCFDVNGISDLKGEISSIMQYVMTMNKRYALFFLELPEARAHKKTEINGISKEHVSNPLLT